MQDIENKIIANTITEDPGLFMAAHFENFAAKKKEDLPASPPRRSS
jgi:hypothetical protein